MNFNSNFYKSNTEATKEQAIARLKEEGYNNFYFTGMSRTNGASFYFKLEDGQEARVSDHPLTGRRAFETIQVRLNEVRTLSLSNERRAILEKEKKESEKRMAELKARLKKVV